MLVDVTSMMASVPSSTFGSGTVSTRTSRLPCQVTAFIATSSSILVNASSTPAAWPETAFPPSNCSTQRYPRGRLRAAGILRWSWPAARPSADADDLLRDCCDARLCGGNDTVPVLLRLLVGDGGPYV